MSVSLALKTGVVEIGTTHLLAQWNSPVGNIGMSNPLDVGLLVYRQ